MASLGENTSQDSAVSAQISEFLRAFQQIEVSIPGGGLAQVHAPYMLLSTSLVDRPDASQHLAPPNLLRLQRARAARESAGPVVRELLAQHFYDARGVEQNLARGRAEPEPIRALLQEAVNLDVVPARQGGTPAGRDLRQWLKQYGIGVDCSGFVQQALAALGNDMPFLRCPRVYHAITAGAAPLQPFFREVTLPGAARPGDVLVSPKHMRILLRVESAPDGGCLFHLAESTSGRGIPAGGAEAESDIGPRLVQVRYARPDLPVPAQLPAWKQEGEGEFQPEEGERSYRIARYETLERK